MRRRLLIVSVVVLLAAALLVPIAAQAGGIWHSSGDTASALWVTDEGTEHSWVSVHAIDGKQQSPPGNGSVYSYVYVDSYTWDENLGTLKSAYGWAELAPRDFVVSGGLKTGKLRAVVPMYDWVTGDMYDADVSLDWLGVGRTSRDRYTYHYNSPYIKYSESFSGTSREAVIMGAAVIDGEVYDAPAEWASLSQSKAHSLQVE